MLKSLNLDVLFAVRVGERVTVLGKDVYFAVPAEDIVTAIRKVVHSTVHTRGTVNSEKMYTLQFS